MAGERHGEFVYFQLGLIREAEYTICHGITPQIMTVRCLPGANFDPGAVGDVTFTDGVGSVTFADCRIVDAVASGGTDKTEYRLRLEDRRWKWQYGAISGEYNQLDPHGKLILWTIRSPEQLATMLLEAMEEQGFKIDLPPGLEGPQEAPDFLPPGEQTPPSATNPPVRWNGIPPMVALQELAEMYGRHVVLHDDDVWVVPVGSGEDLPDGNLSAESQGVKLPAKPDVLACIGAPTRYQFRVCLQAVGRDWDDVYRPLAALSYCPTAGGKVQVTRVNFFVKRDQGAPVPVLARTWTITINGVSHSVTTAANDTTIATDLANLINADVNIPCTAAYDGTDGYALVLTGKEEGVQFSVSASCSDPNALFDIRVVQAAAKGEKSFKYCPPPLFPTLKATDRLTREQAIRLAQSTVWKCYQIILQGPDGKTLTSVPGCRLEVTRRQQLYPLHTKVDQVVPADAEVQFKTRDGFTLIKNYYNGYSRDMPAEVFGSVSRWLLNATYIKDGTYVTGPKDPVYVSFDIDPDYQVVIFSDFVYTVDDSMFVQNLLLGIGLNLVGLARPNPLGGAIVEPRLVLETSFHVRDPETNQFDRYILASGDPDSPPELPLGEDTLAEVHEDVQLMVTTTYNDDGSVKETKLLEQDPLIRAQYYVDGLAVQFPDSFSRQRVYNGIMPVFLDGMVYQVTYSITMDKCYTTASLSTEHHPAIPEYPARRRMEGLPPAGSGEPPRPSDVMAVNLRYREL